MTKSADPIQLASEEANWIGSALFVIKSFWRSQLIWTYTVCKGRIDLGSAGQGLTFQANKSTLSRDMHAMKSWIALYMFSFWKLIFLT